MHVEPSGGAMHGGATFSGLGKLLAEHDAAFVDLYVTHGIFSNGTVLPYIRRVHTTDSYKGLWNLASSRFVQYPVSMSSLTRD